VTLSMFFMGVRFALQLPGVRFPLHPHASNEWLTAGLRDAMIGRGER